MVALSEFETQSLEDWEAEAQEAQKKQMGELQKYRELIHRTFEQTESGQELLTQWTEVMIMTPSIHANSTQFEAGIMEGKKQFVRDIITMIKSVEA